MSTILLSIGETKPHAPLSSGQTVAVFQQLHGEILKAMQMIEDQHRDLERKGDGLLKLSNDLSVTHSGLQDLKQDFKTLSERVDVVGRQAGDGLSLGERLRAGLQSLKEDVNVMRDGQKKTNTTVDTLKADLKLRTDDIKGLRADVDEVVQVAVQNLHEKTNQTLLNLRALTLDHEKTKKEVSQQKNEVSGLSASLKATRESLEELGSTVGQRAEELQEARDLLQATRTNLEITNAVVYKLNEAREATELDVAGLREGAKATNVRIDLLHADHAKTARDLATAREDVATVQSGLIEARQGLAKAGDHITALRQGQDKSSHNLGKLTNELAKVRNLADSTQQHLEVTNSMVLPNLGPSDMNPSGLHSSTEGARSLNGTLGTLSGSGLKSGSSKTPRGRREATWVARNIGIVPDRMSWI